MHEPTKIYAWADAYISVGLRRYMHRIPYLPNQSSGFNRVVSLRSWKCSTALPELSVWTVPNTVRVVTLLPFLTDTSERLQYTEM